MSLTWDTPPDEMLVQNIEVYHVQLDAELLELARSFAVQIESWMKANAPWTDRTTNARTGLYADVEQLVHRVVISFDHTMSYGVFLEFANAGRFAIIGPALDVWTPRVFEAVKQLSAGISTGASQSTSF